jgi:uncharacterized protein (TIGR03118 family)
VNQFATRTRWLMSAAAGLAIVAAACSGNDDHTNVITPVNAFNQINLVSDVTGRDARVLDPFLVNPWGLAFSPGGVLWVANEGTGTATLYDPNGFPFSAIIGIPGPSAEAAGRPTGLVWNGTNSFTVAGGPAKVFFGGLDGVISAWGDSTFNAQAVIDNSATGAVYTGLAIGIVGGANRLYAADFAHGQVSVFDGDYNMVNHFTDPDVPAGYSPFNVAAINGKLYVTYALLGPDQHDEVLGAGNGFVDIFDMDGTLVQRFASQGGLNAPWAVTVVPAGFGPFEGDILVGNFGDGMIGVYNPTTGAFIDWLRDGNGNAIAIESLWGLGFGPTPSSPNLYFAAGVNSEAHGLLGAIVPK